MAKDILIADSHINLSLLRDSQILLSLEEDSAISTSLIRESEKLVLFEADSTIELEEG